jgi:hypothetical protein
MVQKACEFVELLKDDKPTQLKLIDTLRTVTAGKVRARSDAHADAIDRSKKRAGVCVRVFVWVDEGVCG